MTANELRIGNWVQNDIGVKWKFESFEELAESFNEERDERLIPFPIPITPDILLKCGFEKEIFDYQIRMGQSYQKGYFVFSISLNRKQIQISVAYEDGENGLGYIFLPLPTGLHQLQNLYFSLTNNELNIEGL